MGETTQEDIEDIVGETMENLGVEYEEYLDDTESEPADFSGATYPLENYER